MNNTSYLRLLVGLALLGLLSSSVVSAVSYVEQEVYDALERNGSANIIVEVVDNTGIVVLQDMDPEEKYRLYNARMEVLVNTTTSVLEQLSETEFTLTERSKSGRAFYGIVTREGFETLLQIPEIDKIYLNGVGSVHTTKPFDDIIYTVTDESTNTTLENESKNDDSAPAVTTPATSTTEVPKPSMFTRLREFLKSLFT